jgi:hypothetical protein
MLVNAPCLNKIKSQNPLTVCLPNGSTMESTHTSSLYIPELNKSASIAHILPGTAKHSLLSVGQLCNEGYSVTFSIDAVTIYNSQDVQILKGPRNLDTGIWRINLGKEYKQHPHEHRSLSKLLAKSHVQTHKVCPVAGGKKRTSHNLARYD